MARQILQKTVLIPMILALGFVLFSVDTYAWIPRDPGDEFWWDGFAGNGVDDGLVADLCEYDGNLVAVGNFDWAGGIPVGNIAGWNGSNWFEYDFGFDATATSIAVYRGDLIVGGYFEYAGDQFARRLARWDGSQWHYIASFNGTVHRLLVYNDELYVGGSFYTVNSEYLGPLVRFDGDQWHSLGIPAGHFAAPIVEYQGMIVAGSDHFPSFVAQWDGESWTPLGSGLNDYLEDLIVFEGKLYAGGRFTEAGGQPSHYVACWDGENWASVGHGFDYDSHADVLTFEVFDGQLHAGGEFWTSNGVPVNHISVWNGSFWAPLGSGLSYRARASEVYQGALYVGGDFEYAGGHPSEGIARWDPSPGTAVDQTPSGSGTTLHAFPNPFNPLTTISFTLPEPQYVILSIHDSSGRRLVNLVDESLSAGTHTCMWNGYDGAGLPLPSGIYFAAIEGQGFSDVAKLVLLK